MFESARRAEFASPGHKRFARLTPTFWLLLLDDGNEPVIGQRIERCYESFKPAITHGGIEGAEFEMREPLGLANFLSVQSLRGEHFRDEQMKIQGVAV